MSWDYSWESFKEDLFGLARCADAIDDAWDDERSIEDAAKQCVEEIESAADRWGDAGEVNDEDASSEYERYFGEPPGVGP